MHTYSNGRMSGSGNLGYTGRNEALVRRVSGVYLAMLNRRRFLNDLTRHEAYLCSHLREISKRCRISSVLISGISAGRRTWMDASDAELEKAASYVDKNDAGVNPRFK